MGQWSCQGHKINAGDPSQVVWFERCSFVCRYKETDGKFSSLTLTFDKSIHKSQVTFNET